MPIERRPGAPRVVVRRIEGLNTLYEVRLSAPPPRVWRAAFLRPLPSVTGMRSISDTGRLHLDGAAVYFRTVPGRLSTWLRRIDTWIAHANSVVMESDGRAG
jgi:hypothetical protein